jgi:hypothetical protein
MADKSNNWAMVDLSAKVGGAKVVLAIEGAEIPMAQFSMSYGLNAIPQATALIALGRDARTGLQSPIYAKVEAIKQMSPVRVFIKGELGDWSPRGNNGAKESFPVVDDATIFIGYVAGISYRRSSGRISLTLNLVGQLVDLALSSGGSKDVVPGAPNDLMLPMYPEGAGAAGTAAEKFTEGLPADLPVDFSSGLLKVLQSVSQNNQVQTHNPDFWCGEQPANAPINTPETNGMAAAVIEGNGGKWQGISNLAKPTDVDKYVTLYPLKVHNAGYEKAATFIGNQVASSLSNTSMWGMLIGSVLPSFGCGIVPWASGAILAPILTMASDAQVIIKAEEYVDFDLTTESQRPLYGVGVMGNYQMGTINKSENPKLCAGAIFVAKSQDGTPLNDGMWLFVNAPGWMDDWVNFDPEAATGDADINKTLNKPSHDATGADKPAIEREPGTEVVEWNDAMQQYARMMYAVNALKGREGTIVGKLRFDIAPGTTVLIQARGDNYLSAGVDTLATDLSGFIAKVHISINAEQASATTAFEVTNLRTAKENESQRFSMLEHPFFRQDYFKYAPLVPALTKAKKDVAVAGVPNDTVAAGEGDETNIDTLADRIAAAFADMPQPTTSDLLSQADRDALGYPQQGSRPSILNALGITSGGSPLPTPSTGGGSPLPTDPGESGQTLFNGLPIDPFGPLGNSPYYQGRPRVTL